MPRKKKFTLHVKRRFCRLLVQYGGVIGKACEGCGISYVTYQNHYRDDPEFAKMVDIAKEEAGDRIEAEAMRRGVEGIEVAIRDHKGEIVGTEKRYSDGLLKMVLKAAKPEKYSDKSEVKHTGSVEHNVKVEAKKKLLDRFNKIIDVTPVKDEPVLIEKDPQGPIEIEEKAYSEEARRSE